jgi:glycine cleavage system H protein
MADARYPSDLRYHSEHLWARVAAETATIGITWFAQDSLGEIVFVSSGRPGDKTTQNTPFGDIESVKTVSDLYAPLSGEIVAVNDGVAARPTVINEDPYGAGWLVKIRLTDPTEADGLLDAEAYRELTKT